MASNTTVTAIALNPAIDRTVTVPGFTAGATNRVQAARLDPGGKGINVARVLQALGGAVGLAGFLGEANGRLILAQLERLGLPHRFVMVPGENRVNLKLVDPAADQLTEVNDLGFTVTPELMAEMTDLVRSGLPATGILILAGSLPTGVPLTYYRELTALARTAGVSVILDADGEPLRAALEAHPTLIKPNQSEAERLLGCPIRDRAAVIEAAKELRARGPEMVAISCGAEGAVLATEAGTWWATPPAISAGSAVGAGDSMVAALALALSNGSTHEEALRLATAAGAATASLPGTQLADRALVEELLARVRIEDV